jgi:hypothetical protein
LPTLATDTVIGRSAVGSGDASAISFSTIIDEGGGLADGDFTSVAASNGNALIQTATGVYGTTVVATDSTNNSIAKRTSSGKLQATALIIGGTSTYEVLAESSGTLSFKTPAQGTILTAAGASKPTINTGGNIKVGDIAVAPTESTIHAASDFGSTGGVAGGTTETSAIAARWIYSSFIEAPGEKNATSTGIGIGAGIGKTLGGADVIAFITGGNVEARVTTTGVETDDVRSITANTDLTLSANGTGSVYVNDTLKLSGNITKGTGTITVPNNTTGTMVIAGSSTTTQSELDLAVSATGAMSGSAEGLASTDSPTFAGLTVSNTNTLTVRTISTGAAATTGTITGNWSLSTGSRLQATYADLAEYYEGDREYAVGTVLVFGGDKEVTESATHRTTRVAGVVSDQSAYIMNSGCPGIKTCVALQGRVPVNVIGAVAKGDMLVASSIPGYACVDNDPKVGTVIGKAVGVKTDTDRGTVEAVVGRV